VVVLRRDYTREVAVLKRQRKMFSFCENPPLANVGTAAEFTKQSGKMETSDILLRVTSTAIGGSSGSGRSKMQVEPRHHSKKVS
jgi:hypothetical protein